MKKNYLFLATAALVFASCANDDFVGNEKELQAPQSAIAFNSNTYKATRAGGEQDHATSAASLDNNFVVFGWKTTPSTEQIVFDHYNVNYVVSTANSTESNTADWEYVAQDRDVKGTTGILGNLPDGATQDIKYWDMAADKYDFVAFSLGKGVAPVAPATDPTYAEVVSGTAKGVDKANLTTAAYKLTGSAEALAASYIADKVTIQKANYKTTANVQFKFRSLGSKVRVGIYETIPGYSVKAIEFYPSATGSAQSTAVLYTDGTHKLPAGAGTMTVTFPQPTNSSHADYNKAHVSFTATNVATNVANKDFGTFTLATAAEKKEVEGNVYLGRFSNSATIADASNNDGYDVVLPNEAGVEGGLTLKVKFTLLATDGSGEEIVIDGATANVPQEFTQWKPNYAYTYLFKISDNVNVGPDQALYPISFDAVVVESEDGVQETITNFENPSITTYAKGEMVTANNEYLTGANIYVAVNGETLTSSNVKLYTAALGTGTPAQGITEESVANAIANGGAASPYVVTDANGVTLTVTAATAPSIVTEIDKDDTVDGNAIAGNFAKFTPSNAGYYVFEYSRAAVDAVLWVDGETGNEDNSKTGQVKTPAVTAGKFYKVINVVAGS